MANLEETLAERGKRYGSFAERAEIADALKDAACNTTPHKTKLAPDQKMALDMIFNKISRVLAGDPDWADSWHDIAGYAKLVEDRLNADQASKEKKATTERNRALAEDDPWADSQAPQPRMAFGASNIVKSSYHGDPDDPASVVEFSIARNRTCPIRLGDCIEVTCDSEGHPIEPRIYFVQLVEDLANGAQRIGAIPNRHWVSYGDFRIETTRVAARIRELGRLRQARLVP
jgi:hypothetical protein